MGLPTMTGISMSKSKLFIDTGGFIAMANKKDQYHQIAATFYRELKGDILRVTSNLVVSESYTFLRYKAGYPVAMHYLTYIKKAETAGYLQVVFSNARCEEQAVGILEKYSDHDISYVDAVSFAIIMSDEKMDRIFSFDHHFNLTGKEIVPVLRQQGW